MCVRKKTLLIPLLAVLFSSVASQAQVFESSNLPIVRLNTFGAAILDDPKTAADIDIVDNGPGQRNHVSDPANNYHGKIMIEIRGSSSQMFPKKQYGFELVDDNGADVEASLLGMPAESDWILFAPYNDKSLMRDVLAYTLGAEMGHYAPRTRYCELMINNEYKGIYVLIEKIKRDNSRVDINRLSPDENSGDDLTGGYIIKIDKMTGDSGPEPGWNSHIAPFPRTSNQSITFLYEYPDADEISFQQKEYILNFMRDFENTLYSSRYADPLNGYARYIDVASFVDFFLINELSKNVDGYRLSTYFHKQRNSDGGKLVMGPIWDFNLGFGNANYCTSGGVFGLVLEFNSLCPGDFWLIPFWWTRLLEDPAFKRKCGLRWIELRAGVFSDEALTTFIDSTATSLDEAQVRNFQAWPVLGQYVWPNFYVGDTYDQEVDWLKDWVTARAGWMDEYFADYATTAEIPGQAVQLLNVFPNPSASGFFFATESRDEMNVTVFDALGRPVFNNVFKRSDEKYTVFWGEKEPSGVYYYLVDRNGKRVQAGTLIKK